jgi:TonB family protein
MFEAPKPKRSTSAQVVSFVLHAALVYLVVAPAAPLFVHPIAIQLGRGGHSTELVFSGRNTADISDPEDSTPKRYALAYVPPDAKTIYLRPPQRRTSAKPKEKASAVDDAARAGSTNGSVVDGLLTGHDVRPALPVLFPSPEVYPWQVPNGVEGTVIVEVTIDVQGNVIATKIIQRLGHGIDEKVVAAVRNWRFRPAMMDGRPIASQQDVLYRFPS